MARWWQTSWKRRGRILLFVFLAIVLLDRVIWAVEYQLAPWEWARTLLLANHSFDTVPATLPDKRVALLLGDRAEYYGFSSQLPWKHTTKTKVLETVVLLYGDGGMVMLENPSSDPQHQNLAHEVAKAIPDLTPENLKSICDLQKLAMQATTSQVKWWKTPGQNRRTIELLNLRFFAQPLSIGKGTVYRIESNGLCGFQQGDPQVAPYRVSLDLYDQSERHYKMTIASQDGSALFTQAQINAVIASIHPSSQVVPTPNSR